MKYRVYKLIKDGEVIYVGITKHTLRRRKSIGYRTNPNGLHSIRHQCDIELLEETDDVARERYWMDVYKDSPLLNAKGGLAGEYSDKVWDDYKKQYYQDNKEKFKEYNKRPCRKEKNRQYYLRKKKEREKCV